MRLKCYKYFLFIAFQFSKFKKNPKSGALLKALPYLILNWATFLNAGIIDDSALYKDFSIKIMSQKSIERNR